MMARLSRCLGPYLGRLMGQVFAFLASDILYIHTVEDDAKEELDP